MSVVDQLRDMPDDYQLQYCWARAVEWKMFVAFLAQSILPVLYLFYSWKLVLLGLLVANSIWNLLLCTAVISLRLAAAAMLWSKLKWLSITVLGVYFLWSRQWLVASLTALTPIIAALVGQLTLRRPVELIQEFFMLQLGHVKTDPSPEVQRYLSKTAGR